MTFKSLNIVTAHTVYRFLSVCCVFGEDELSPGSQRPLIRSARLHVHCFLALMYYREQAVVCTVTAWIKLCHSFFTAAAVLFCGRSAMLRGEGISLMCQLWSLYLNVDWTRQRWRSFGSFTAQGNNKGRPAESNERECIDSKTRHLTTIYLIK